MIARLVLLTVAALLGTLVLATGAQARGTTAYLIDRPQQLDNGRIVLRLRLGADGRRTIGVRSSAVAATLRPSALRGPSGLYRFSPRRFLRLGDHIRLAGIVGRGGNARFRQARRIRFSHRPTFSLEDHDQVEATRRLKAYIRTARRGRSGVPTMIYVNRLRRVVRGLNQLAYLFEERAARLNEQIARTVRAGGSDTATRDRVLALPRRRVAMLLAAAARLRGQTAALEAQIVAISATAGDPGPLNDLLGTVNGILGAVGGVLKPVTSLLPQQLQNQIGSLRL